MVMRSDPSPVVKDLVLIGGGHSHAIALKMFGMRPLPGVRLTLIADLPHTPYSGMLPGYIAGFYDYDEAHIDLRPLAQFAQSRLYLDRAVGLDLERRQVLCANRPSVAFDYLSINIGSTPAAIAVPGAAEYAAPAKPVPQLLETWNHLLQEIAAAPERPWVLGIVGGGVGGVELTLNMQARLHRLLQELSRSPDLLEIHLFQRQAHLAPERNRRTQRILERILRDRGVHLHLAETVTEVEPSRVRCQSGLAVKCDAIFWVTNAAAPDWIRKSGLATDEQGFIAVKDTLQSCSHDFVFAAGDVATMVNHPRPKAGVFAVRQGKPLYENLRRILQDQPLKSFVPQKQFLTLIGTGDQAAIASRGPFALRSRGFWTWKDAIDRKFMRRFSDLPEMGKDRTGRPEARGLRTEFEKADISHSAPSTQHSALDLMRCGGCGSKVGSTVLERVLRRVNAESACISSSADVLIGLDTPDDAAVVRIPSDRVLVQTVDYFRAILDDPFLFGQISTNHCLSDLFAMGATPQSALAIAVVPEILEAKQEETLYQLLSGAAQVLTQARAPLIGGHTSEGSELAFGLACNGLADPQQLTRKGRLAPGQVLILTKALGTGTLFAADMRRKAKGRWIESAIASMLRSNQDAAACLRKYRVQACTDITGFGLLGHLVEMVKASDCISVELWWDALPILPGARETIEQGIISSLQPQNLRATYYLSNGEQASSHPDFPLLFDPQTSGGLLGAVPAAQADDCLTALCYGGYPDSQIIGRVLPGEDPARPLKITNSP